MIIESGLDIPNVNTLIISRADRFGLSQLYQLRGRVGRANQIAYAYLLVPPISHLTKSALQRLRFIEEFSELGAGFNIAMRDLEMRGAGNVLGAEQSGHIAALGYELYMKIIEEAAQELKFEQEGKPIPDIEKDEIKVELNVDAFLPDDYVDPSELKVDIYRRLANESNILKIKDIKEELKDRFGSLPEAAENLFNLVELKLLGRQLEFKTIRIDKNKLIAYFSDKVTETNNAELMEKKVSSIIDKAKREFHFLQDRKKGFGLVLNIPMSEQTPIEYVKNFLKKLL
jgi:transcription-repair coupling factor (superfamily II helicase)